MAEFEKEPSSKDADPLFSTLLAESPELWDVVGEFVETLPARVQAMQDALRDGSLDQVCAHAQRLKGVGGSYGYEAISRRAAEIEKAAHDGVIDDLSAKIADIHAMLSRIRQGLEKHGRQG
ncbi:MAG: Hpt domain-containing protein [Planctomycetota bacterium]